MSKDGDWSFGSQDLNQVEEFCVKRSAILCAEKQNYGLVNMHVQCFKTGI